jgi:hypothetical protein
LFKEIAWPDRSSRAEKISLEYQASRFTPAPNPPTQQELERAIDKMLKLYPTTEVPKGFGGDKVSVTRNQIQNVLYEVKRESSPGAPWSSLGSTKGDIIDKHSDFLIDVVLDRLELLSKEMPTDIGALEMVRKGLCDPVRVFVKNEPHKLEKVRSGRLRLISSISIADEVIERLLFSEQNKAEIAQWNSIPSKPGIGFTDKMIGEHIDSVVALARGEPISSNDAKGWDWSYQAFMYEAEVRLRVALAKADPKGVFARIVRNRIKCLSLSLFMLSDGQLFEQLVEGIMKSGSFITSSANSKERVLVAYLLEALWVLAMGDDANEDGNERDYSRFGLTIERAILSKSEFEFCSHLFKIKERVAEPLNWEKMLFRLLQNPFSVDLLTQFLREVRHSPQRDFCKSVIRGSGWVPQIQH